MQNYIKTIFEKNTLIPAIVQDYYSGVVLMLAYVNYESYKYMLESKRTCFWSRKNNRLWKKGDTSGNIQLIKTIEFDCDNDTLLIQVEQKGIGACHLGTLSCFPCNDIPNYYMINVIEQIIQKRIDDKNEKSYTNYLINAGVDKICKKIGEESAEVIIAAKNEQKESIIYEIADLIYHLLVLMNLKNIKRNDILEELKNRYNK